MPSLEEIIRAVGTIAVFSLTRGSGHRRPSYRAYNQACALVTRYRAQARQAAEIVLNERGRRALEMVLGVYRVISVKVATVVRALARRNVVAAPQPMLPFSRRLFAVGAAA